MERIREYRLRARVMDSRQYRSEVFGAALSQSLWRLAKAATQPARQKRALAIEYDVQHVTRKMPHVRPM